MVTLTGSGCMSGCVLTYFPFTVSGSWTNTSPARLTLSRQRLSFSTNNRTCGGVISGTSEISDGLTETFRLPLATVRVN